jgi:Zn-dependent protease
LLATLGMLTNLVIAGILLVLYQVLAHTGIIMVHIVIEWLAFIWFMLTIFNIIPGFPLDGGKLLRAFLWKTTGKYEQVTRIISWVSWGIGIAIAIGGIVLFITTQQWFAAVLLILPGFIMQNAATQSRRHLG